MVTRILVEEGVAEGAVVAEVPLAAAAVARIKKEDIKTEEVSSSVLMGRRINSRPLQQQQLY